jgi:hypothetical protein
MYFVQFLFAFGLGIQVWQVLEASIGDSLSMNTIQEGFNRTVFEDFLQVHGASISPLIGILRWIIPVYALITIFFHSGLIYNLIKNKNTIKSFVKGGALYYLRSIIISLIGLGLMLFISAIIWLPFIIIIGNPIEFFDSEKGLIFWIAGLFFVNVFLMGIIWWWTFATRIEMIKVDHRHIPWKKGIKVFGNGITYYIKISLLYLILNVVIYFIYAFSTNDISAKSVLLIVMLFLFQQIFNLCRIGLRIGYFKSLVSKFI